MMQPVEEGQRHDTAQALDGPPIGCILAQGKMCSDYIVIISISAKNSTQMAFTENYYMVEAFASDGANQPLGMPIPPGRPWSNKLIANTHASHAPNEDPSVGRVPVPDQVGWGAFPRKCFCKLSCDPLGSRIRRSSLRITSPNKSLSPIVGTVNKSSAMIPDAWLRRKVRQFCDGGRRLRTMYLATVAWDTSMPSFSSSP